MWRGVGSKLHFFNVLFFRLCCAHVRVHFCAEFKTFKFLISWLFTIIIYVQSFQDNLCVYVCVCVCVCKCVFVRMCTSACVGG